MSTLLQHLEVLYPLARVLSGPDEAERLLQRVYERAAQIPPEERPDDQHAWLSGLVIETLDGPFLPSQSTSERRDTSSFSDDPFRQDVARQTAERALPVAFAACSIHERFLLALDVLGNPSDDGLAAALNTSVEDARAKRDEAWAALRAALRDVLTGPERMLVDVALPSNALEQTLQTLLTDRFQPVPLALRSKVNATLEDARRQRKKEGPLSAPLHKLTRFVSRIFSSRSLRRSLLALLVLAVLAVGGMGLFSVLQPTAESSPNLISLSANQANTIQSQLASNDLSEAERYVYRTWNRRISAPTIQDADFQGVGHFQITEEVDVPVFLYTDASDSTNIAAFAYSYALLDRLGDRTVLEETLRDQLAQNEQLLTRRRDEQAVVLWRHRDDIFIAVAPSHDPEQLKQRIRP